MASVENICFPFGGELMGGSCVATLLLIEKLDRSRFRPMIVLHEEGHFAEHLRASGIPFQTLPLQTNDSPGLSSWGHLLAVLRCLVPLARYLRREEISLVHTNEESMGWTWALPALLMCRPLIWHQHGKLSVSRFNRLFITLASRIVCVSDFVLKMMPQKLSKYCRKIYNPFVTGEMARAGLVEREKLLIDAGISPENMVIGFFGSLTKQKRPEVFLEVIALLAKEMEGRVQAFLAGDDRENRKQDLVTLSRNLGIGQSVHFLGYCTPINKWISVCSVVLAPAENEGFGRVLVESMIAGVPVVAADSGGHREIISSRETGVLVPLDNPKEMAKAAKEILTTPLYSNAISDAAHKDALSKYGVVDHVRRIEMVYEELLLEK